MNKTAPGLKSRLLYFLFGVAIVLVLLFAIYTATTAHTEDALHDYDDEIVALGSMFLILLMIWHTLRSTRYSQQTLEQLHATEQSFHQLFASNPSPMWICDQLTLQIIDVNNFAVEVYGYSKDEFRQMTLQSICLPDDADLILSQINASALPQVSFTEIRHRLKNGRIIEVEILVQPLLIAGQTSVLVIGRDISERKQSEAEIKRLNAELGQRVEDRTLELATANSMLEIRIAELHHTQSVMRQREERFRTMVEDQTELIVCSDKQHRVTLLNEAARRTFQMEGIRPLANIVENIPEEDRALVKQCFDSLNRDNPVGTVEHRRYMPDGGLQWFRWTNRAVYDLNGNFMEFQGVGQDITERKQRERQLEAIAVTATALRNSVKRDEILSIVIEQVVDMLAMTSTALIMYDEARDEVVFEQVRGMFANGQGKRQPTSVGLSGAVTKAGVIYVNQDISTAPEMQGILKDGDPLHVASVPLISHGRIIGGFWITSYHQIRSEDIRILSAIAELAATAIDRAEITESLEARVVARTSELKAANIRLKELDQLKSKFIHDISHELRTPISILNTTAYLLEHGAAARHGHYVETLKTQMSRLSDLIDDILKFADLDEELNEELNEYGGDLLSMSVNLTAMLDDLTRSYKERAELNGLTLDYKPADVPLLVPGSEDLLRSAFNNLLRNAVSYTATGTISVQTVFDAANGNAIITVKDTGTGMSEEEIEHIFEPFYRGKEVGQLSIPGSGVGLSLVQRAVLYHRGTIHVESKVGEGSTFTITLPMRITSRLLLQ